MAYDFLSHKPEEALVEVKEILYARLEKVLQERQNWTLFSSVSFKLSEEIEFLRTLLDKMERS